MARRTLRVTAAVTGMAALGAGIAGTAFAGEPNNQSSDSLQTASIDGFSTESVAPTEQLSGDLSKALAGGGSQKATTASPTDGLSNLGGFQFEMPPTEMHTAGEGSGTGLDQAVAPTGGQEQGVPGVSNQPDSTDPKDSQFANDNGLPGPADGPANDATSPATSQAMPAMAMMVATLHEASTNNDATSNHSFQF